MPKRNPYAKPLNLIAAFFTFMIVNNAIFAEVRIMHNLVGYTMTGPAGNNAKLKAFSALAIDQGKVVAIGESADLLERYPSAKHVDAKGKYLLPGLTDAHGHILGLGQGLTSVDLRGTKTEQEAVGRVKAFIEQNPEQKWIIGRGWNQVLWPNKQFPTAASLDQISKDKIIVLSRVDGHAAWVNSNALAIGGISASTQDPDGGQIIRDDKGSPTGVLIDTAEYLVTNQQPKADKLSLNYALDKAFSHLVALGITSVHDAGIGDDLYNLYQERQKNNNLPLRVYAMLDGSSDKLSNWLGAGYIADAQDKLSIRSVKLYSDGALGSRGAALLEPYSDQPDHKGLLVTQPQVLEDKITAVMRANFQANIHAIGDRGNRIVLNSVEKNLTAGNAVKQRHRIEHTQVVALSDLPRIKELDMIASMQPTHATSDMNMAEDRVGPKRIKGAYAWRTLLDQGTIIASGSDFPVELANPFHGLHAAVTRQNHNNLPQGGWKPEQKMILTEAFRTFTLDAAFAAHQENVLGTLEPNKWADFIIVDRDIFNMPEQDLWQVEVLETWIAGEKIYQKSL